MTLHTNRRLLLKGIGASASFLAAPVLASGTTPDRPKFIAIFLRGAADGLSIVPPHGDPAHVAARAGLAGPPPGEAGGAIDLDGFFGLHPLLPNIASAWSAKELLVFHAIAAPYRQRSHFDAQNLVENGTERPYGADTGWLGRALAANDTSGIAISSVVPVIMRGSSTSANWSPGTNQRFGAETVRRIKALYMNDENLAAAFAQAQSAQSVIEDSASASFVSLAQAAARFLTGPTGTDVAFMELGGWDSHSGQLGDLGAFNRNLTTLDDGIGVLKSRLGDAWRQTIVAVFTEFGRTVAMNGSGGSDHGTAGTAFLLGGGVNGGRVRADWPGLAPSQLLDGRDLKPTSDLRSVFKSVLNDHMRIDMTRFGDVVFPSSGDIPSFDGIVR